MSAFQLTFPAEPAVPIIISSPHSGTRFPDQVAAQLRPEMVRNPDDTDWFIDRLYDFAPDMGITMIAAVYNRWVIDLNRDPDSKPLYDDGRVITSLVPETNFNGDRLYPGHPPAQKEIDHRLEHYFRPYHSRLAELIASVKARFGKVLLFEAHSIRKRVPGIREEAFPDLILGDNEGRSAGPGIIRTALESLRSGPFDLQHNHPFKGGYITRHYGNPSENVHTLQLEMAKTNYMDDTEMHYEDDRAERIRSVLKQLFRNLANQLAG